MKDVIYEYILKLVRATRSHPYIERGASPRATIALVKMTKFAFLALLFCIYYIAGMYESPALMVLFLTQLLLLPVMFLLSVYLKRHLTVLFAEKTVYAEQGLPFTWRLQAENSGRLPVSRFLTKIRISRIGRRVQERKKVQGSSECGIQTSEFRDVPEHCGIERFRAERVKVYDYLSLFSRTKEMEDEMKVIVFPRKYDMRIETESAVEGGADPYRHDPFLPGRDHDEVRQIREYRDSDSIRHIHWNQTARSGQLWVKEYEEEKTGRVSIFLDLKEEIFLEDCGWTPVEVTPSSDGSYSTSYPGLDTDMLEEMISAAAPEQNDAAGREDPGRTETDSADESGSILQEFSDDLSGYRRLIPAAAVVILLCAALSLYLRRRFRRRQAERMDCRGIFGRFLEMLRCAGYMSGCTGAEEGFAEALSARLPCLSREEAERLVGIVSRAAYGSGGPREEENEFAREIYFRTEGWIRKELKGLHRLRFKYIGGF